jgi:hypothetical protein
MSILSDNQVRLAILEILHKSFRDNPKSVGIDRKTMQQTLNISENQMDSNMLYLEEKMLVKLHKTLGSLWAFAKITAYGMDVVEDKERFAEKFPFIKVTIQNIGGNVYGPAVQAVDSQVSFSQNITNSFKRAYQQIDENKQINAELKGDIKETLRVLEEELRKNKDANAGTIQKAWGWLKRNADWLVPTLSQVVSDGIKIALGFP